MGFNAKLLFAALLLASASGVREPDDCREDRSRSRPERKNVLEIASPKLQDPNKEKIEDVRSHLDKEYNLYSTTEAILENLKESTRKASSADGFDDRSGGTAYRKHSFYRPYLDRVLRVNSRLLVRNMLRKIDRNWQAKKG